MFTANISIIGSLSLILLAEICGQSCLRKLHAEPEKYYLFFVALLFYAGICFLLMKSYSFKSMGSVNALWSSISVLTIFLTGLILFNEPITLKALIGAILIIAGITCILTS